ncbi:head-tail connector protein [Aquamicrobium segne]|uniref:Head-tail connector protein n=1 Tax=Aquamicrobium segne TaxID=469547 RepID=A0ABW0GXY1_9HYPH
MTLIKTVEPSIEPVTLAQAKAHLRLDHSSEDDLLSGLVRAAREEVERATGMALVEQGWRLVLDTWPRNHVVMIPLHPVREIVSVTVYGPDGEASLVNPASYQGDIVSRPARIRFATAPVALRGMNGVEIDFVAGFGEVGTDVPDLLQRAILLLVAHWYEFRTAFGPKDQPVDYPGGYDRLIAPFRSRRL